MSKADVRKAAVLLLSLPRNQAADIVSRLELPEIEAVTSAMAVLEGVSLGEQERVILEFARLGEFGAGPGREDTRTTPADDACDAALDPIPFPTPAAERNGGARFAGRCAVRRPLEFLNGTSSFALARLLADERPQLIALVASHVSAALGAELIGALEPERQLAVIRAVTAMEPTDPAVLDDVADVLAARTRALAG
ncbi:MAG: hypothetical protein AB7O59_09105 [Pirellulales bacterium]